MMVRRLIALIAVAMLVQACTKSSQDNLQGNRGSVVVDSSAATSLVESIKQDTEATGKSILEGEAQSDSQANRLKQVGLPNQSREQTLLQMHERTQAEKTALESLRKQRDLTQSLIQAEEDKIAKDLASIAKEREKLVKVKKKTKAIEKKLSDLDSKEGKLKSRSSELAKVLENIAVTEKSIQALSESIQKQEAKLADSIQTTRDFFTKNSVGDVFDRINGEQKLVFLVRIIGFGSADNLSMIRSKVDSLTNETSRYKEMRKVSPIDKQSDKQVVNGVVTADDSILVESTGNEMKAIRDQVESELQAKNRGGENKNQNSLWLVIRPIDKVRVGMKLTVAGSNLKYMKGALGDLLETDSARRSSSPIAEFDNIRSSSQKVLGIENLDLSRPGSYVFSNEAEAKVCATITQQCLETLVKNNLLEGQMTMQIKTSAGKTQETATRRELLSRLMKASIYQTVEDLKEKMVLGVGLDKFDRVSGFADYKAVLDKFGFSSRAPVIDSLSMSYTVSLVEQISAVTNHMDTFQFLTSGLIGDVKLFDLTDGTRGEIAIPLPIQNYQPTKSILKDLTLPEIALKFPAPLEAEELVKLDQEAKTRELTTVENSRRYQLAVEHAKLIQENNRKREEAELLEFERRSVVNAGILSLMTDSLEKK